MFVYLHQLAPSRGSPKTLPEDLSATSRPQGAEVSICLFFHFQMFRGKEWPPGPWQVPQSVLPVCADAEWRGAAHVSLLLPPFWKPDTPCPCFVHRGCDGASTLGRDCQDPNDPMPAWKSGESWLGRAGSRGLRGTRENCLASDVHYPEKIDTMARYAARNHIQGGRRFGRAWLRARYSTGYRATNYEVSTNKRCRTL
jgi:hypothetical protein